MSGDDARIALAYLDSQAAAPRRWILVVSGGTLSTLDEQHADGDVCSGIVWDASNTDAKPTLADLQAALPAAQAWAAAQEGT